MLLAALSAGPGAAQSSSQSADGARVALIEATKRSVVHVKAVLPAPPTIELPQDRRSRKTRDIIQQLTGGRTAEPRREEGSGFVIDAAAGLILTAAHIVDDAVSLSIVQVDGTEVPAERVGVDHGSGIALLRAPVPALRPLKLASRIPAAGETGLVVGYMLPLKSVLSLEGMVMGTASSEAFGSEAPLLADYLAFDAALPNGGFGGAPVIDRTGEAIGIVSAIFGHGYGPDAITMILPVAQLRPAIEQLASSGRVRRGWIGAEIECAPFPCVVSSTVPGGPADLSGIRAGDRVVSIGGVSIARSGLAERAIAQAPIGATLNVELLRPDRTPASITIAVKTAANPEVESASIP